MTQPRVKEPIRFRSGIRSPASPDESLDVFTVITDMSAALID
jgi:hypothetical protein